MYIYIFQFDDDVYSEESDGSDDSNMPLQHFPKSVSEANNHSLATSILRKPCVKCIY